MPFVSFSSQLVLDNATAVSNVFINEYLPSANGDCVRVYLYGLCMCNSASRYDNTLEHFSAVLNLPTEDIISAFTYWHDQGLVQLLAVAPIEVKYLPIKANLGKIKKYSKDKYADFNASIQSVLEGRMITPTEYSEYYAFLEAFHVEPAALVMVAKHCANLKGSNVGYNYILTVAKNWAYAGVRTVEAVEDKLEAEHGSAAEVGKLLKTLGQKRSAEPADFELYNKWTRDMGYSPDVIGAVAKGCKSISKLDSMMLKYFELKLFERTEIADYEKRKSDLTALAISINRKIGEYIPNVEPVIENYLTPWILKGFDADTLQNIAAFCFKSGKRTLAAMDAAVNKFYKLGAISSEAIQSLISDSVERDNTIKGIFSKLGITRNPNQFDRDFYNTWTQTWGFADDVINYAATLSANTANPMQYLNKILSGWFSNKVSTLEAAKAASKAGNLTSAPAAAAPKSFTRHSWSSGELTQIFSDIDLEKVF